MKWRNAKRFRQTPHRALLSLSACQLLMSIPSPIKGIDACLHIAMKGGIWPFLHTGCPFMFNRIENEYNLDDEHSFPDHEWRAPKSDAARWPFPLTLPGQWNVSRLARWSEQSEFLWTSSGLKNPNRPAVESTCNAHGRAAPPNRRYETAAFGAWSALLLATHRYAAPENQNVAPAN